MLTYCNIIAQNMFLGTLEDPCVVQYYSVHVTIVQTRCAYRWGPITLCACARGQVIVSAVVIVVVVVVSPDLEIYRHLSDMAYKCHK